MTAETSCSACTGSCPGLTTPSSLTVSGLMGILAACPEGGTGVGTAGGCPSSGFNGFYYATYIPEGDSMTVNNTAPDAWQTPVSGPFGTWYCVPCSATTGQCMVFSQVNLGCGGGTWQMSMNATYTGYLPTWNLSSGTGPTGTYSFVGDTGNSNDSECGLNSGPNSPYPVGDLTIS